MSEPGQAEPRERGRRAWLARSALTLVLLWFLPGALGAQDAAVRPVKRKLYVNPEQYRECVNEYAFVRGEEVLLSGDGMVPGETVEIVFSQGDAERSLAPARANAKGNLNAQVRIPADAATDQDARFIARAAKGEEGHGVVLASALLQIFADAHDSDGDGFSDPCDTCPNVASKDLTDSDYDGLGDACDKCPNDAENDSDGDGLCADVDPNPYAPEAAK